MPFKNEIPKASSLSWPAVGRGILVAVSTMLILAVLATLIFYVSNLSERFLPWTAAFILFLGAVTGGWSAACRAGGKGLIHGSAVGVGLFLVLWIVAAFAVTGPLSLLGLAGKLVVTLTGGALGGILGVGTE
ncbi:TIGR04086 family membrane protein [Desulforudis sp. 1088]|uniref:TIGR04086 family membrane protein n=1 Tax=unclassified Candidatus Desulforudis TaxID=2635950 RepID=UPI0034871C56